MLLAIDTSAGTSVAIVGPDGSTAAEHSTPDTRRHAEVIGDYIDAALRDAGVRPAELDAVACGMGPGPFTGLRVGVAAARMFALATGLDLLPIVSHDAIAFDHYRTGRTGRLLVVTDARRRERYWSAYSGAGAKGVPARTDGPGLARPDELPDAGSVRLEAATVSASALGGLAQAMRANGHPFAADRALYLRSPDVTLATERKRVTG